MEIEKIQSALKMDNFFFTECHVKRTAVIADQKLDFSMSKNIQNENGKYTIELDVTIRGETGDLFVNIKAFAIFSVSGMDGNYDAESLINNNAIAIMFPFIRSEVTLLTSQPGMMPIVLPPINITKA